MKSSLSVAFLLALPLAAQDDTVLLVTGAKIEGVKVQSYTVREVRYAKGGSTQSEPTDRVLKVELARFNDVFRLGLKDADLMLTKAREQVEEKNLLLAQFGLLSAASQYFDDKDKAQDAMSVLDELQKAFPESGLVPDIYRLKFEYYMGQGQKGAASATAVAKKYQTDATGGAWPAGLLTEAEFFLALAENMAGGSPKDFQLKLRGVAAKGMSNNPLVANRANVQLAHSLRENKDPEGARKIYDELVAKDNVDTNSRAGALLGLGHLALNEGSAADTAAFRKALLYFLRVRLETREAWQHLQAEAMYFAILAADKWKGNEFEYIKLRCRTVLYNDFGGTEWATRAKSGR